MIVAANIIGIAQKTETQTATGIKYFESISLLRLRVIILQDKEVIVSDGHLYDYFREKQGTLKIIVKKRPYTQRLHKIVRMNSRGSSTATRRISISPYIISMTLLHSRY